MKSEVKMFSIIVGLLPHFFCCILPCIIMVLNVILGTSFAFRLELLNHDLSDILLVISGIVIVISYFSKDKTKSEKIILYITTAIFIFSLISHSFYV
jgi:hypothetical protein